MKTSQYKYKFKKHIWSLAIFVMKNNIKSQCCHCQDDIKSHRSKGDHVSLRIMLTMNLYCLENLVESTELIL